MGKEKIVFIFYYAAQAHYFNCCPFRSGFVKKARRTSSKAKAKRLYNWKTIVRSRDPFGNNFTTTLNYADSYAISPAVVPVHVLRMNSIYDPDYTTTGHQPMGRDQLAELYNRYRVLGFSYEVWGSETSTPPLPCFLIVCPTNGNRTLRRA